MNQILERGLPKWACMLVKGEKITPEQAAEVLIRTNSTYLSTNNRSMEKQVYEILGARCETRTHTRNDGSKYTTETYHTDEMEQRFQMLDLTWIHNSRILSAWIGGPNGWCDWEGNIAMADKNLGKYPSGESIYNDWVKVAEAFPFLDLRAQILPCESTEALEAGPGLMPTMEFRVKNGEVTVMEPIDLCAFPRSPDISNLTAALVTGTANREFGLPNLDVFREKVEIVKKRLGIN